MSSFHIRQAQLNDVPLIYQNVIKLAEYHDMIDHVHITEKQLYDDLKSGWYDILILENHEDIIGSSMIYEAYSSWNGRTLFMEELFIESKFRHQGYGQILYDAVLKEAQNRGCHLIQWQVAPDNKSGMQFYRKNGARFDQYWVNASVKGKNTPTENS